MTEQHKQPDGASDSALLMARRPIHPALARAHDRVIQAEPSEITSYDRMHHRHNRS